MFGAFAVGVVVGIPAILVWAKGEAVVMERFVRGRVRREPFHRQEWGRGTKATR